MMISQARASGLALFATFAVTLTLAGQTPDRQNLSAAVERTAAMVAPAIVEIFATSYAAGRGMVPHAADLVRTQRASGSGVIVDPDGFIVTNAHVVRGAQRLEVSLARPSRGQSILAAQGRTVPASIVGIDLETDLAILRISETGLPALAFGDSDDLRAGQLVLAIGNPLGFENSVSLGVVSSIARQLEPESPMIYVQTDATIRPGSSGGALVDLDGRLVGVNTLLVSESARVDGLAFSAPSNIVRAVYEQIRSQGRVRRGDIGIRAQTITPVLAAGLGLPREDGVILSDVLPGSPADAAGLRPGDLVTAIDGKTMENARQLQVNLYRRGIGDVVTLTVLRNGEEIRMFAAVAERDDPIAGLAGSADPRRHLVPRLGMLGLTLDRQIAARLPGLRTRQGVLVASTVAGALDARDGGLAAGDVVYAVNRQPVPTLDELRARIDALKPGAPVVLHLERRGELMFLAFTVE